jgi:hypothetical protein
MSKALVAAVAIALALALPEAEVLAQGVAPGGPIGNSTGIGSGLGGVVGGTGPSYPNGTTQPTLPTPPPPGGGTVPTGPPHAISTVRPPSYPRPLDPFGPSTSRTSSAPSAPLSLPEPPTSDLSFLKGCWRTGVFRLAHEPGVGTYCFDDKGSGRFLYQRVSQPDYFCRASAQAGYVQKVLRLRVFATTCSDGREYPESLDCSAAGAAARCDGTTTTSTGTENWTVQLHRVR